MNECPATDALVTVAEALAWEIPESLEHLRICNDCRARISLLVSTRAAYAATEPVPEHVLARITRTLADAARAERVHARTTQRLGQILESVLAGATAATIIVSAGVQLGNLSVALVLAFFTGAGGVLAGRGLVRRMSE